MIAADTNIVLRLILDDDADQVASIRTVMSHTRLYVPLTVMLEIGWVLASRYQLPRDAIASAVIAVMALDGIQVARPAELRWAIERFRAGADWADMIHVVAARKLEALLTLDRRLSRQAGESPPTRVETLA